MTKRMWWTVIFLGVFTGGSITMEILAAAGIVGIPWTEYIVTYVPEELTTFVLGGLAIWAWQHFRKRYKAKKANAKYEEFRKAFIDSIKTKPQPSIYIEDKEA